jgi:glycosyltransferase involved in cell wall biosynthesis
VPADDLTALAGAMRALFDDDRRREAIGARARESVLARYGVDRLVHDLGGLYRALLPLH